MVSAAVVTACALAPLALTGCGSGGGQHPDEPSVCTGQDCLIIKLCSQQGCESKAKRVALEQSSRNAAHLVSTKDDALTLKYEKDVGGPRVYLINEEGNNSNMMFALPGSEFTFDVELSTMDCGFNAALYFVGMTENAGGAEDGTNYCDAQAVGGTFCSEMDLFEGNAKAQQFTTHGCVDACASFTEAVADCANSSDIKDTVCDHSGCGMNPFRYGPDATNNEKWYGAGAAYSLDASKSFTVTTQFHESTIARFYVQNGKRIDLPTLHVGPEPLEKPVLKADYCDNIGDTWDGGAKYAPLAQMLKNMENGMVLAMSAWYDPETYVDGQPGEDGQTGMSWMDGNNSWGEAGPCHETTSDDGDHQATFSNIRFGPIGTTTNSGTTFV